jgi:hypothetical protein
VEWSGGGSGQAGRAQAGRAQAGLAQGEFSRRTGAQSSLSPSTPPHCS